MGGRSRCPSFWKRGICFDTAGRSVGARTRTSRSVLSSSVAALFFVADGFAENLQAEMRTLWWSRFVLKESILTSVPLGFLPSNFFSTPWNNDTNPFAMSHTFATAPLHEVSASAGSTYRTAEQWSELREPPPLSRHLLRTTADDSLRTHSCRKTCFMV